MEPYERAHWPEEYFSSVLSSSQKSFMVDTGRAEVKMRGKLNLRNGADSNHGYSVAL